ncbi:putative DNA helicase [Helianthus debilis subsp. tardiflorus]
MVMVPFTINQYGIEYGRLHGSMSSSARDSAVKDFNTDPEVPVMLMSLKVGNLGLNTVSASHVILYDLCLNLTTEDQAIDQAHRISQTRPVTVSRLIVKNTVEDIILALQDKKRKMAALAFGEDQSETSTAHLTNEDLRFLFMGHVKTFN